MRDSDLLSALQEQSVFFHRGGYGYTHRSSWRPTLLIRDSPLCLKATAPGAHPCAECMVFLMVPPEKRSLLLPCHNIPLNQAGDTIATLYAHGTQEELDRAFHDWLFATIQRLQEREAGAMKVLESRTAISFKNILFLTDFTAASETAFSYALAFARHFDARLYPAHVVSPFLTTELETPVAADVLTKVEDERRTALAELVKNKNVASTVLVAQQSIEEAVPLWIKEHGIDLIVIGTHGRKGLNRFFLGSTAEEIVRTATCPVLTVGPGVTPQTAGPLDIKQILFAASLNKESEPAVSYALSFARERDADVAVLHVLPAPAGTLEDWKKLADIAQDEMKQLVPADETWPQKTNFFVEAGNTATWILEYARKLPVGLIVLGLSEKIKPSTHFRRGVAYRVISSAPCAVLTVR